MRVNKKGVAIAVAVIVVMIGALFLALPPVIKYYAVKNIDESTGRKSAIRELSINPFKLTAEVKGVRLSERGSNATFLSLSSASVELSPASLPKRSFIVTELRLNSPYLHLVRTAPNRYNFSDLLEPKPTKKKKETGTPYLSLNNIIVSNASVDLDDKALKNEKLHRIREMQIALPFVSNIPYLADRYVAPHFSAVVNGSPFRFDGRLKPLTKAVEASFQVNLKGVDLPYYLGYLPVPLPVQVRSGTLSSALELSYRVDERTGPELKGSGTITLDRFAVREMEGRPLAELERARLDIARVLLFARQAELKGLELNGLELYADRDRRGKWNFQKLGERPAAPSEREPKAAGEKEKEKAKPFLVRMATFSLKDGTVHLADATPAGGFRTELRKIELGLSDFSNEKGHPNPIELSLHTSHGETARLSGSFVTAPAEAKAKLSLEGIRLKDYYPYLRDLLASPVAGTVGLSADLLYNGKQGVVVEKGTIKARDLSASYGNREGVRLKELLVSGAAFDLNRKRAAVEKVELRGGDIALSGGAQGISAQELLRKPGQAAAPAQARAGRRERTGPSAPFSYRIEKVSGSGLSVRYTDKSNRHSPQFALNRLSFSIDRITGPKLGVLPVRIDTGFGRRGSIHAAGNLTPQPLAFRGRVQLQGIPLRDFDAYIPENTTVFIVDGALDTNLALNVEKQAAGFRGSFSGSAGVRSFYCQDTVLNEDLLKWERLELDRFNGTIAPFTLAVSGVSLSNSYSRVIVQKDGTLNLQHLVREEEPQRPPQPKPAPRKGPGPAPAPAVPPGAESPAQPHPIRVDTVTVQGGTIAFSDRHLEAPFDTTFYNVGGRVSGLTSEANRAADVDLRGNLENHSPLSIRGAINPLRGDLFLDLRIAFNDIELSPLTPYAGTYLGYGVDKGKLFLDLSYKIDKKALSSTNKVFIDQFSFGKAIPSAKATKLPVRLAVALLKDRKGEIHLDLPVAGRTDDPQFSVWKVVLQILKNLIVKAATSPIALLSSMFGSGQDFSAVYFPPGSDRLDKPEQEKLVKLSKALHDRPALNLEISGFVDRDKDPEGYRGELLLKKMKGEKFRKMVKEGTIREGQTQEETEIEPQEYSLYLKQVYVKEKFPKPRNFVGMLKDLPDEEMQKLIFTHTQVGSNELQGLARERAEAVKSYLAREGKLPPERLFEKSADIYKAPTKNETSASRVEFGASAK